MTTDRTASSGEGLGDKVRRFLGADADPADEQGDRWAAGHVDPRGAGPQPPPSPGGYGDVPPGQRPPAGSPPGPGGPGGPVGSGGPADPRGPVDPGSGGPGGPADPRGPVPDPGARDLDQPAPGGQRSTARDPAPDARPGSVGFPGSGGGMTAPAGGGDLPDPEQAGLLRDSDSLRSQWQQVQGTFVDDPQRAVREAGALVDRTLEEIKSALGSTGGDGSSTEDLRVTFQRYREFFHRLLSA